LAISSGTHKKINLKLDVKQLFNGVNKIKISEQGSILSIGLKAAQFSSNFTQLITLRSIQ